jgi:hypothetical protein
LRQGDISVCEFHQLRSDGGEPAGPGRPELANEDLPYLGPFRDYSFEVERPAGGDPVRRVLRLWFGPVMVVHQNCEIEYADPQDARIQIAPIVSEAQWPSGPWPQIRKRQLPSFAHLPAMNAEAASELGLDAPWPEAAVALAGTTCVSRGIAKPNRILSLVPEALALLQESIVRFSTVRGWGDDAALSALAGKQIVAVKSTSETVAGPAPIAKVILSDENADVDEISVAWGIRRSGKPLDP